MMDIFELYSNLKALTQDESSGFLSKTYPLPNGNTAEIFDYRLAGYSVFLKPNAKNGRGTAFELSPSGEVISLLALPMKKFFSYEECPETMKLDMSWDNVKRIMDKPDGSLMSTYLLDGVLFLKSKGSIQSKEVKAGMSLMNFPLTSLTDGTVLDYPLLRKVISKLTEKYTVDLEYTGPENQIVLRYQDSRLTVLCCRDRETGIEYSFEEVVPSEEYDQLKAFDVSSYDFRKFKSFQEFQQHLQKIRNIEGVVVELKSGLKCKFKVNSYLSQHRARGALSYDSRYPNDVYKVNDPIHLLIAIVSSVMDDVLFTIRDCPPLHALASTMREEVTPAVNAIVSKVHQFYDDNQHLDKRDYAMKANQEMDKLAKLAIAMKIYGACDFEDFFRKNAGLVCDLNKYKVDVKNYPS